MYSLTEKEKEELGFLEKNLFFSNGVLRYTKEEVQNCEMLSSWVLRLQNLYNKSTELFYASYN